MMQASLLKLATYHCLWVSLLLLGVSFTISAESAHKVPAYWLWAGHPVKKHHHKATLYLHQGFVSNVKDNTRAFYKRGFEPHKINAKSLYIVIRMHKLLYDDQYVYALATLMRRWEKHGNLVKGLQLDFDSASSKLLEYSRYLKFVRKHLPKKYSLSITGLGDWLVNGNKEHLLAISKSVDEITFQLYQHKTAFTDIKPYISKLAFLKIPFKIGLIEHGHYNLDDTNSLSRLANYKGSIIFSIKQKKQ